LESKKDISKKKLVWFKRIYKYLIHAKNSNLKIKAQDTLPWTIIGKDLKLKKFQKMYNGYHIRYKYFFIKPILMTLIWIVLKVNKKVLGKALIPTEKMSKEKCNKILLLCNKSMEQSLKESSLILKKNVEAYKDPYTLYFNRLIKMAYDIFMQNVMYDTYYRGVFEMFMFNLAINVGEAYKDDKTHVLYNVRQLDNIDYYMAVERNDKKHLVLNSDQEIVVIPKGAAIRLLRRDVETMLKEIETKNKTKR